MNWVLALNEVAKLAAKMKAVRDAGFTTEALYYPRDDLAMRLLCAWNNVPVDKAPPGWLYFPNKACRDAWQRVAEEARKSI